MEASKYQRLPEINNVMGFVVNIHDPTNFDIDFKFSDKLCQKYSNVITNKYKSVEYDSPPSPSKMNTLNTFNVENGITHRCHLRGIGISQYPQHYHTQKNNKKSNQLCLEITHLIDRTDRWIICTLSDIDIYKRLLVDVIINTCTGPINIREYLLTRMSDEDIPIFYAYKTNY